MGPSSRVIWFISVSSQVVGFCCCVLLWFSFLAVLYGLRDLSSLTRDQTWSGWSGIKLVSPAVEVWRPNYWTAGEFPLVFFLFFFLMFKISSNIKNLSIIYSFIMFIIYSFIIIYIYSFIIGAKFILLFKIWMLNYLYNFWEDGYLFVNM